MTLKINNRNAWLPVLLLAIAASLIAYFQSGRVWPMIDYAYQMENGYRILLGQVPYKDFGLVLMPGTYWVIAGLMKLFGVSNMVQVLYTSLIAGLTIPLAYFILSKINDDPLFNLILTSPLIFTGHALYPFPSYDINAAFFIILGISFFLYLHERPKKFPLLFLSGILIACPFLFKQNTGIIFALSFLLVLLVEALVSKNPSISIKQWTSICLGSLVVIGGFVAWLLFFSDIKSFFYQTVTFATQIRPLTKNIPAILLEYLKTGSLLFYTLFVFACVGLKGPVITKKMKALIFFTALFATVILPNAILFLRFPGKHLSFMLYFDRWLTLNQSSWFAVMILAAVVSFHSLWTKRKDSYLFLLLPFVFILTSNASFLAQGVVGSAYGIWPFLFFMMALIVRNNPIIQWKYLFMVFLLVWCTALGLSAYFNMRLNYVLAEGPYQRASNPLMKGLGSPGPWIQNFEGLLHYVDQNIPPQELILTIPGEDPFYVFSGRVPTLPYEQINYYTLPPPAQWMLNESVKRKISWIVYKTSFQTPGYKDLTKLDQSLPLSYEPHAELPGYLIYKLKAPNPK